MENVKENIAIYNNTVIDKNNVPFFSIQQNVEIPENRRLTINIPNEIPAGKARLEVNLIPFIKKEEKAMPLLALRGSCKGIDTMDAYFARKQANKAFEDRLTTKNPYKIPEK